MARPRGLDPVPLHRRSFVALTGLTLVAAGCGVTDGGASTANAGGKLVGLQPGAELSSGRVVAIHPVQYGAIPVVLETDGGARFQVDVMARDPEVSAPAQTDTLALYVVNAGDGATATDEAQGLSAMALAQALRERNVDETRLPELLTMSQRSDRHPDVALQVPLG